MKREFDFSKNAKWYITFSLVLLVIILVATAVMGIELDIQFKGGSMVTYAYEGELDFDQFENVAKEQISSNVAIQQSTDVATGMNTLVLSLPGEDSMNADQMVSITDSLRAQFPENNIHSVEINNVDPTIGKEFLAKCMVALLVAMLLMLVYVAIRFRKIGGLSAGTMGVVALLHDCVIVFGVFILFRIPINDNFIAVILTILGFSLNDTIVIYDRVRENKRLYGGKMAIGEMVSKSINQSLSRSINTSLCAIAAMVVVTIVALLYSVESILSFSFPLILGLVSGSYSSICIAGPLWIKWQEYKLRKKAAA